MRYYPRKEATMATTCTPRYPVPMQLTFDFDDESCCFGDIEDLLDRLPDNVREHLTDRLPAKAGDLDRAGLLTLINAAHQELTGDRADDLRDDLADAAHDLADHRDCSCAQNVWAILVGDFDRTLALLGLGPWVCTDAEGKLVSEVDQVLTMENIETARDADWGRVNLQWDGTSTLTAEFSGWGHPTVHTFHSLPKDQAEAGWTLHWDSATYNVEFPYGVMFQFGVAPVELTMELWNLSPVIAGSEYFEDVLAAVAAHGPVDDDQYAVLTQLGNGWTGTSADLLTTLVAVTQGTPTVQ
jgi:hypothetical protein